MKKIVYILFFLSLVTHKIDAQDKVILRIEKVQQEKDSLLLTFSFDNQGDKAVRLFKPKKKGICCSIVNIYFTDEQGKEYKVFPCDEIIDMDKITVDCKNSVYLESKEKFYSIIKFGLKDMTPYLDKGRNVYNVNMKFNYRDVNFEGEVEGLCRTLIKSNCYNFKL